MSIHFNEENKTFHLQNLEISYVIGLEKEKYLTHRYWGKSLPFYNGSNKIQRIDRGFATNPYPDDRTFSLNSFPFETSTQGTGDHRIANYQIRSKEGHNITNFFYQSHIIKQKKERIPNLPSLRQDDTSVTTLEIIMEDTIQKLQMKLVYSIFEDYPILTRHVEFKNFGDDDVFIENAGSMSLDMPMNSYEIITLNGSHTNEATISRQKLHSGIQKIESNRGTSSPQHQPFLALVNPYTSEFSGEVYSFHLIYSGNFIAQVEVEQYGTSRVQVGINPDTFEWKLKPQESFYTPEVVLNYTNDGLNGMSQTFHKLYQNHLIPPYFAKKDRPILLNTWEASYFDLSEKDLLHHADIASEIGIELFVIDDGWFGKRDTDESSLGDWFVNKNKLPNGITGLSKEIHKRDMKFGLWFEPEMISKNSNLFREHPDWALQVLNYPITEGRHQYVLDLSRIEVQSYLIDILRSFLKDNTIDYIKWDMNRHLTEVGSVIAEPECQKEISHRYVLGLYHILETITQEFPKCLFENCSSGGGRFDPGMMFYMSQTWTSDNTDALCRSVIQYGYSYLYPPIMMGAHVSTVPNHQVGRITPLNTRALIAMSGNLGYELDLTKLSELTLVDIKEQILFYKTHKSLFQFGDFYRLQKPNEYYATAWLFKSKEEAIVIYFNGLARPAVPVTYLPVRYLDDTSLYIEKETNEEFSGAELNYAGITIPRIKEDFATIMFHFKKKISVN